MMVQPSVTELLKKDKPLVEKEEESTVTLAADEIAEGKVIICNQDE